MADLTALACVRVIFVNYLLQSKEFFNYFPMTKLSVNINKVATIRNARGGNVPDVIKFARDCETFGAEGITVHPRPDERHIRYNDVRELKKIVTTEFNIEGYPQQSFIDLVCEVVPTQVTLVPDPPEALTSNAGWQVAPNFNFLSDLVKTFHKHGIRVSIFTDCDLKNIEMAAKTGADRIELYTEPYATAFAEGRQNAAESFAAAAAHAQELSLGVNAGHDLNLHNLKYFLSSVPGILEVSIGHALISDALYLGIKETIRQYKNQISQ